MKFLPSILIAYLGVAWALPSQTGNQTEIQTGNQTDIQTEGLLYVPCENALIFSAAYCCARGTLGNVSECIIPLLPLSDELFAGQCTLFQKTAVCCIPTPSILSPPILCVPLPTALDTSE